MCLEKKGTLIILTCHGVYDPDLDEMYANFPADRPIFETDIYLAFNSLK